MRIPPLAKTIFKGSALVALAAAAVLTADSVDQEFSFKPTDKAFYADANTVAFVRPGLSMKITDQKIASDGTMSVRLTIADPKGLALDREGITTPGAVSISCIMAYIPSTDKPNSNEFVSYTTRVSASTISGQSATQAATDSGGTWTKNADGDYTYTFKTKAPATFDASATHRIGCAASRSLTEFDLGTNYATVTKDFVPNGGPVKATHDVVRDQGCNNCHGEIAFHGGSRRGVAYCVMCHTQQTTDPDTGNTVDFPVMVHKIHMGEQLTKGYKIIGFGNATSDWSSVALPSDPGNCKICHDPAFGATQANNYLTQPSRKDCGACHDNVNFATGENHVNLVQTSDNQCSTCHIPHGELPFDASIEGAHVSSHAANTPGLIPDNYDWVPGMVFGNLQVQNGTAGKAPTITFTLKDKSGKPISIADLKGGANRMAAVLGGSTADYGYTNFGSDVTTGGYVSEDLVGGGATCDNSGNCSYTFKHAIPADAKGTFSIGLEGRRALTILPGTKQQINTEYGAHNLVVNFSVDGSPVVARRTVVDLNKCNNCHTYLSLHGTNRDTIGQCVLCHNGSETDAARRPATANATEKAKAPQAIDFAYMIHRIHTGEDLKAQGAEYTVIGFGGSVNDFTEVRYPAMTKSGGVANTAKCDMCHTGGSEQNLPEGKNPMKNPQLAAWSSTPATTAACTGCHATKAALSHAYANTTIFGESCSACHGAGAEFAVSKVHAQ